MNSKHHNNLRHYRLKRKLTQQAVLRTLGHASASRLSAWENGQAVPSSKHLMVLSDLYRVSLDKLVGGFAKKHLKPKLSIPPAPLPTYGTDFQRYFGKAYEEMSDEELLDIYAQLLVETYFSSKGINSSQNQEVDFLQTGSSQ